MEHNDVRTFGCPRCPLRFTLPCHTGSVPSHSFVLPLKGWMPFLAPLLGRCPYGVCFYGLSVLLFVLVFIVHKQVNRTDEFDSIKQPSVFGTSEWVPINPRRCTELALCPMCAEHE